MVLHTCNSSTQEAEVEGSRVQGPPGLHGEFQVSLAYKGRPCLKKKIKYTNTYIYTYICMCMYFF
jgi:hypothetical protein